MMCQIPIDSDWENYRDDQDILYMYENFFGNKSNEQIRVLLKENFIMRCLDLASMPEKPFLYYVNGFMDHLEWEVDNKDEIGFNISSFLDAIESRHKELSSRFWNSHPSYIERIEKLHEKLNFGSKVYDEIASRLKNIKATC